MKATSKFQRAAGFTMIELVVVMAVLGLLLSIAMPRYLESLERGREQVLAHNLAQMREAIDRFYGDRGSYPDRLDELVERRYLRAVPVNPFTEAVDWQLIGPPAGVRGAIFDVAESAADHAARRRDLSLWPPAMTEAEAVEAAANAANAASATSAGTLP